MHTADQKKKTTTDKFARALLTTTCLTAASGAAAHASLITEGTAPAPSDFPNFLPGYALPRGTTQVNGVTSSSSDDDWFEFSGLVGGSPFTFNAGYAPGSGESGLFTQLWSDAGDLIVSRSLEGGGFTFSGVVPANGNLVGRIGDELGAQGAIGYTTSLDAAETPEPGTIVTAGLALAGALAWRVNRRARV